MFAKFLIDDMRIHDASGYSSDIFLTSIHVQAYDIWNHVYYTVSADILENLNVLYFKVIFLTIFTSIQNSKRKRRIFKDTFSKKSIVKIFKYGSDFLMIILGKISNNVRFSVSTIDHVIFRLPYICAECKSCIQPNES